jgi:hypothetical protein
VPDEVLTPNVLSFSSKDRGFKRSAITGNAGYFFPAALVKETDNTVLVFNGAGKIGSLRIQPGITFEQLADLFGSPIQTDGKCHVIFLMLDGDDIPTFWRRQRQLFDICDIEPEFPAS